MKWILADVNLEGSVDDLVQTFFGSAEWSEFWKDLGLSALYFEDLGLDRRAADDVVWQTCQDNGLVLITGNRNKDDSTSLEATIRARLTPDSLPVNGIAAEVARRAGPVHRPGRHQDPRNPLRHRRLPGHGPGCTRRETAEVKDERAIRRESMVDVPFGVRRFPAAFVDLFFEE